MVYMIEFALAFGFGYGGYGICGYGVGHVDKYSVFFSVIWIMLGLCF